MAKSKFTNQIKTWNEQKELFEKSKEENLEIIHNIEKNCKVKLEYLGCKAYKKYQKNVEKFCNKFDNKNYYTTFISFYFAEGKWYRMGFQPENVKPYYYYPQDNYLFIALVYEKKGVI